MVTIQEYTSKNVRDYIKFGSYPQTVKGIVRPIEWQVLDVQDNKALLISKFGLDVQPYNNTKAKVTWDTCSLRSWLNKDFLNMLIQE